MKLLKKGTKVKNRHIWKIRTIKKIETKRESSGKSVTVYVLDDNSRWESELLSIHWEVLE